VVHFLDGEGPISFWGYKEQESKLILPERDDDGDDDDDFLDGIQTLIYMSVTYISTLLCLRLILTLSQIFFKRSVLSAQASLAFHSGSCNIPYKKLTQTQKSP